MKDPHGPVLFVLGASGALGRAVCDAARRTWPRARLLRGSRRARGAGELRVDVRDPAGLRAALAAADVAICAVGPFEWDPAAALEACGAARCHWVDLADRPRFIEAAEGAAAGIAVASGCSVAPGLIEALAEPAGKDEDVASLRAWWSVGSRKNMSAALLYALLRPLGRRDDAAGPRPGATQRRSVAGVPYWFGGYPWPRGPEARAGGRPFPVEAYVGMDHPAQAAALRGLAPFLGRIPEPLLLRASRVVRPATRPIQRMGGARGALAVEWLDAAGRVRGGVEVIVEGGLDLAAFPAVWAARALASQPAPACGAVSLASLVTPAALSAAMREAGWAVTRW